MTIEELQSQLQALADAMLAKGYPYAQAVVCIGSDGYPDAVMIDYEDGAENWHVKHAVGDSLADKLADAAVWVANAPAVTDPAEVA